MAKQKYIADTALQTLNDPGTSLATATRWAFDYDNSADLDLWLLIEVDIQFDTGPPTAGDRVFEVWVIPGDGEGTEKFADGGDASVGTDDDPAMIHFVGEMQTVNPSTGTDEVMSLVIPLYPDGNRIVLKNVSGSTIDAARIARGKPWAMQN